MPDNAISLYYHHSVRKFGLQHSNSPVIPRSCWDLCIIFVGNNRRDKSGQRHKNGLKEDYKLSGFLATLFITSTGMEWNALPEIHLFAGFCTFSICISPDTTYVSWYTFACCVCTQSYFTINNVLLPKTYPLIASDWEVNEHNFMCGIRSVFQNEIDTRIQIRRRQRKTSYFI